MVGVACYEVVGERIETYEVAAEGWVAAFVICLVAVGIGADADGCAGYSVVDEDVALVVRVACHQVCGEGGEGDVAAVGADRGRRRVVVCLLAGRSYRDAGGVAPKSVVDEDVVLSVGVACYQIGGGGNEDDVLAGTVDIRRKTSSPSTFGNFRSSRVT